MSEYDLIPEDAYESLPQENSDKFAFLVQIAQRNLARLLDNSESRDFSAEIRSQFMSIISSIADALGVEGLPNIGTDLANYDKYQTFQVYLAGVTAKVRLQGNLVAKPYSVELGRVTKARIQLLIDQLRHSIGQSDLSEKKRAALSDKLDEFEEELAKQRLSFARTMAIAASIMTIVGAGTAALANGTQAQETVMKIIEWIGEDKDKEEQERLRLLPPPPKALPSPLIIASQTAFGEGKTSSFDSDLDDDVPF